MPYYKHFPKIQERVDELNEKYGRKVLSLGYIGNLERWGDDRLWYIWVQGLRYEDGNRNTKDIWCAGAGALEESCDTAARTVARALQAIRVFEVGLEAAGLNNN